MFDAASPSERVGLQRAVGTLRVSFKRRDDASVLDRLHQYGCLKARFPRVERTEWPTAVTLNTSGGIAAGDRLDMSFDLAEGTRATVAAQAAERFYRAVPGGPPARLHTVIQLGPSSAFEWLPQETILFDGCALDRRLDITLAADACFLGVETLVFGRVAMGEQVHGGWLRDLIRLRCDGRLLWHDAIRLDGAIADTLRRPATGGGCRALATVLYAAKDAEARLDAVRAVLDGAEAGASAWNGMLVARLMGPDSAQLRRIVIAALDVLRAGRPMPRVWNC
ncbi:MAG: urease accessory protein UreD [Acetobacteraceae bacterium]